MTPMALRYLHMASVDFGLECYRPAPIYSVDTVPPRNAPYLLRRSHARTRGTPCCEDVEPNLWDRRIHPLNPARCVNNPVNANTRWSQKHGDTVAALDELLVVQPSKSKIAT